MKKFQFLTLALLAALIVTACGEKTNPAQVLTKAKWKSRILLVSPAQSAKAWDDLLKKNRAKFTERDLIIIVADKELRQKFKMKQDRLTVVLIGKDGGEKSRQIGEINLEKFFSLIDTMPMRQREIREGATD